MNKMKTLQFFSIVIMFSLFGLLGVTALKFNKYHEYYDVESNIVKYIKNININDSKNIVTTTYVSNELLTSIDMSVGSDNCIGYGVIKKYWFIKNYKGYLKCKNYKTPGYKTRSK